MLANNIHLCKLVFSVVNVFHMKCSALFQPYKYIKTGQLLSVVTELTNIPGDEKCFSISHANMSILKCANMLQLNVPIKYVN